MRKMKRIKRQFKRKPQRSVCGCTTRSGEPKTLFPERTLASKTAGDIMAMWETYKCPSRLGWHIATVRNDPWKKSESKFREAAS